MMILKIILLAIGFIISSLWLMFIISVGVSVGIKNSQTEIKQRKIKTSFQKKEEYKNESI